MYDGEEGNRKAEAAGRVSILGICRESRRDAFDRRLMSESISLISTIFSTPSSSRSFLVLVDRHMNRSDAWTSPNPDLSSYQSSYDRSSYLCLYKNPNHRRHRTLSLGYTESQRLGLCDLAPLTSNLPSRASSSRSIHDIDESLKSVSRELELATAVL